MPKSFKDPLNVLIVEDNELNAKFASAILKRLKYNVDLATDGKMGVEKFLENDYDLILMDIQMPVMNGLQATGEIRKYEKQMETENPIPIIAITAFAFEHDKQNCLDAGMDDYLTKPYRPQELIDIIKKFFPENS
jgi:CheY-like chemotaxis protein